MTSEIDDETLASRVREEVEAQVRQRVSWSDTVKASVVAISGAYACVQIVRTLCTPTPTPPLEELRATIRQEVIEELRPTLSGLMWGLNDCSLRRHETPAPQASEQDQTSAADAAHEGCSCTHAVVQALEHGLATRK